MVVTQGVALALVEQLPQEKNCRGLRLFEILFSSEFLRRLVAVQFAVLLYVGLWIVDVFLAFYSFQSHLFQGDPPDVVYLGVLPG